MRVRMAKADRIIIEDKGECDHMHVLEGELVFIVVLEALEVGQALVSLGLDLEALEAPIMPDIGESGH